MYKHASQIGNILRKEKEKEKSNVLEKRKEGDGQTSGNSSGFYQKKARTFGNFQGSRSYTNSGFRGDAKPANHYWTEIAMKGIISVGDAGEIIRERIVMGILENVIFATKGDIGSMNATLRKGVEVNSRVGNTGCRI